MYITDSRRAFLQSGLVLTLVVMGTGSWTARAAQQSADETGVTFLQDCRATLDIEKQLLAGDKLDPLKTFTQQLSAISCLQFVRGMIAINAMYQALVVDVERRGTDHERGLFCMPKEGVPVIDAVRVLVKRLETIPIRQLEESTPRLLVVTAFAQEFPCKANRGRPE
jgi:hypothetical protein